MCVCVYIYTYLYIYLDYISHLYNNLVIRNSDIILKLYKTFEKKLPGAKTQILEWPIEYIFKMFNIISHQGKQSKTLIIYHCTCPKLTKRKKKNHAK